MHGGDGDVLAGVEEDDQAEPGRALIERVKALVVGPEALELGVQLEPSTARRLQTLELVGWIGQVGVHGAEGDRARGRRARPATR